jgi:hypothetical protein
VSMLVWLSFWMSSKFLIIWRVLLLGG